MELSSGEKIISVALAGNPNSGKTTVFNAMTGARQHVGNYPGVTVEKIEGTVEYNGYEIKIVDLPGTYSLTAYSEDELVSRDFIISEKPDVVVDVIDASNVERHLYLATQLMELGVNLILAFNMSDVARRKGLQFDLEQLSGLLGVPIVEMVASKSIGIDRLFDAVIRATENREKRQRQISCGAEIEAELNKIEKLLDGRCRLPDIYPRRWLAMKLLEQDCAMLEKITDDEIIAQVNKSAKHIEHLFGDRPEMIIADRRYGFISGACEETIKSTIELRHNRSDAIDSILTHKAFGVPVFLLLMYLVFWFTFALGQWPTLGLEWLVNQISAAIKTYWPVQLGEILRSLVVDGIIGGVGNVIVFLPNVMLLFAAIAILEGTGYMARAAFITDRLMHKLGLHGKSFIPMLIGFGCTVPAIMATRILENKQNRIATMLVAPLMSCGARFPIYALIIPAFFPHSMRGPVLWLIYLIGIVLAMVCARLLRATLLSGQTSAFVMELPPYRVPTLRAVLMQMWLRSGMYLRKAGTVILLISIVLWALSEYPRPPADRLAGLDKNQQHQVKLRYSFIGRAGTAFEPAIRPLGFDYKIAAALIGALAAKEVFVAQMGIVYAVGDEQESTKSLQKHLQNDYTPLQGFCVMLFCLISSPCIATVAITRAESGSWKWAAVQWFGLTTLAYVTTLIVYQAGRFISAVF